MSPGGFGRVARVIGAVGELAKGREGRRQAERVYGAAMSQAKRDVDDEAAATALRAEIDDISTTVIDTELADWGPRGDYLRDRACRLLVAARHGRAVAPIEASDRIVFEQEAILARLPIVDAFARLADAEPELRRREEAALAGKRMQPHDLGGLVGPGARNANPALHGNLALKITAVYLWDCAQGHTGSTSSYFERVRGSHRTVHVRPSD
jgi:hypothetical protein